MNRSGLEFGIGSVRFDTAFAGLPTGAQLVGEAHQYLLPRLIPKHRLANQFVRKMIFAGAPIVSLALLNLRLNLERNLWRATQPDLKLDPLTQRLTAISADDLAFLTGVVSKSEDLRLSNLAFENIDNLKAERDILITKSISWLLRDLTKLHREEVEKYLNDHSTLLPAIAVRETRNKLTTGKK